MTFQLLDGPARQVKTNIDAITPIIAKIDAQPLDERQVVVLEPQDGDIYVYFADEGQTPNFATVSGNGLVHEEGVRDWYEAGTSQNIFIAAVTATVDVIIIERS